MSEPFHGLGEALHHASPPPSSPSRRSSDLASDSLPLDNPSPKSTLPPSSLQHHHQQNHNHPSLHSPPSQALEQLSNTLRLQSLAIKKRGEDSTSSLLYPGNFIEPLEVDAEHDQDIYDDPIFQKYRLSRQRRMSPDSPMQDLPTNAVLQQEAAKTDRMDTDDSSSNPQRQASSILGFRDPRLYNSGLPFRRSAYAAAQGTFVVHKSVRMRKRTKHATKEEPMLPKEGEKGRVVQKELWDARGEKR